MPDPRHLRAVAHAAVLDRRTLNRTLLARQCLLERVDADPVELVERLVGMQSQVPLDPYITCWTRLRVFDPDALGQALLDRRTVRMPLLRATLHLVSAADALRIRPLLQPVLERGFASSPFARRLDGVDLGRVLERGVELLERQPQTLALLRDSLADEWPEHDPDSLAQAVRYLVPLVQLPPRGVWRKSSRPTLTTVARWLGAEPAAGAAVDDLVLRYLRSFGPASSADIRTWSWLTDVQSVVDRLRPALRVYRDEGGRVLYDVEDGAIADASTPAPVRFLGQFDNVFLSHADRSRIVASVRWDASFAHRGTFLVDGFVAGAWKVRRTPREATVTIDHRTRLRAREQRVVREEAEALLAFLAPDAIVRRVET